MRLAASIEPGVGVEADEAGVREGLGHQQRRMAVAAADVGDPRARLELRDHAVERRQPLGDEARAVAVQKNAATPQCSRPSCSPQLTPLPVRIASMVFASSAQAAATTSQTAGMNTGLVSSASTTACSAVSS